MKKVLIDSSVWIEYFNNGDKTGAVNYLIENNTLCVNNLILAELVPFLRHKRKDEIVSLLEAIDNIKLDIDWQELSEFQYMNIRHGINNVGIPDLVILQNVMHNDLELFSLDKHFILMRNFLKFNLFRPPSVIP